MPRLLSVSRAARLVGTSRGAMQKRIRAGEITSFEGMLRLEDLSELYPNAQVEDSSEIERIEAIIEQAVFKARHVRAVTPDLTTLARRVFELSHELALARLEVSNHNILLQKVKSRIHDLAGSATPETKNALSDIKKMINEEILSMPEPDSQHEELLARDSLLRIVAAQVHLLPSGHEYFVQGNDSILESGLSAGLALDYGCSNGNCGKCKAKLISGQIKKVRNHDYVISEAEKSQGYILTCSHTAVTDVVIQAREAGTENDIPPQKIETKIRKIELPAKNIAVLTVKTPRTQRMRFLAGQSATLMFDGGLKKEFPIASCPCDDMNIQFHIPNSVPDSPNGIIFDRLKNVESLTLEGPVGHFVLDGESDRPVLFVAFDTGFAPIKSLIEHAMTLDHAEHIHLFWVVSEKGGHYLNNVCRAWSDALENFGYTPLVFNTDEPAQLESAINQIIEAYSDLGDYDTYIAGRQHEVDNTGRMLKQQGLAEERLVTYSIT